MLLPLLCLLAQSPGQAAPVPAPEPRAEPEAQPVAAVDEDLLAKERGRRRLELVEVRLARALFAKDPWRARACGLTPPEPWPDPGVPTRTAWRKALEEAASALRALPTSELTLECQLERDFLLGYVAAEMLTEATAPPESSDPTLYVERARLFVLDALRWSGTERTQRARKLAARLARLPTLWQRARAELVRPLIPGAREALHVADELVLLLEERVPPLVLELDPETEEYLKEQLEASHTAALEATRAFRTWLAEECLPSANAPAPIRADRWLVLAESLSGSTLDPDALEAALFLDVARLAQQAGERIAEPPLTTPAEIESHTLGASTVLVGLGARQGLPLTALGAWSLRVRGPDHERFALARWVPGIPPPALLELALPPEAWSAEEQAERLRHFTRPALTALAVRRGALGEACWTRASAAHGPAAVALPNPVAREAFGLYATDWVLRAFGGAAPAGLANELVRERLGEALLLLVALQVHVRHVEPEVAAETYRLHAGCDMATARRTVAEVVRVPQSGLAYLAYREILSLEETLRAAYRAETAVRRTLDALLAHPRARAPTLHAAVRAGTAPKAR